MKSKKTKTKQQQKTTTVDTHRSNDEKMLIYKKQ